MAQTNFVQTSQRQKRAPSARKTHLLGINTANNTANTVVNCCIIYLTYSIESFSVSVSTAFSEKTKIYYTGTLGECFQPYLSNSTKKLNVMNRDDAIEVFQVQYLGVCVIKLSSYAQITDGL